MLNAKVIDPTGKMDVQIYEGWATVDLLQWRTWIKPRGKTMASILALSAGGAGGNGFTAAAGAARGGGGGGGSGAQFFWTGPLIALPNAMSVQVGAASTGAGISTRLSLVSNVTAAAANQVMFLAGGAVGGNGAGNAAGAAGAAAAVPTIAGSPLAGMGAIQLFAGQAGVAGGVQTGASAAAAVAIPVTGLRVMGGTGGGGVTAANQLGGTITAITGSWLSERRPLAGAAGSVAGSGGHFLLNPFWSWPGLGGGSSNAGVGGQGGPGAFGSGGGGGGGGTTGGTGGRGGPGLVIITCW